MGHQHDAHHDHGHHHHDHEPVNNAKLAASATFHCLMGCGLGEVIGMVLATMIGLGNVQSITLAVILGFVFGFFLGLRPLLKANIPFSHAFKQVLVAEGLSIAVMETAEVMAEVYTPGVMSAGLGEGIFWLGMCFALIAGFVAAYPVNYVLVKRDVRHSH